MSAGLDVADTRLSLPIIGKSRVIAARLELTVVIAALVLFFWTDSKHVLPKWGRSASTAAVSILVCLAVARRAPSPAQFLKPIGYRPALEIVAVTLIGVLLLLLLGSYFQRWASQEFFVRWLAGSWYLELFQQLLLQFFLWPALREAFPRAKDRQITWLAAAIFAFLHFPNIVLMSFCLPASWYWCHWFRRYQSFPAVWLSHIVLGAALFYCGQWPILGSMRVGIGYVMLMSMPR